MFFKEPLTERLFVEPKMVLLWHRSEEPLYLKVHAPDYHLKSTISDQLGNIQIRKRGHDRS